MSLGNCSENQKIIIENGARVEVGVVALGSDSTNEIHLKDGSLRAVLIEGGNEVRDRFGHCFVEGLR